MTDTVRTIDTPPDDTQAGQIQTMLSGHPPDLVVPIGGPAAAFAQRNRQQLFPAADMLFAGVDRRFVQQPGAATGNATAVAKPPATNAAPTERASPRAPSPICPLTPPMFETI